MTQSMIGYIDADGLVSPKAIPDGIKNASGNGVLYTSLFQVLLRLCGEHTMKEKARFTTVINKCIIDGLLYRSPSNKDQEGPDDYIGLACGVLAADTPYAQHMALALYKSGSSRLWFMNNDNPTSLFKRSGKLNLSAVMLRFPGMISLLALAAGKKPSLFGMVVLACSVALEGIFSDPGDTSNKILAWMICSVTKDKSRLMKLASNLFERRIRKTYRNGVLEMFALYYGPWHPFVLMLEKLNK